MYAACPLRYARTVRLPFAQPRTLTTVHACLRCLIDSQVCHGKLRGCRCDEQTLMLENIATIGFFSADFSAVIWGVIIDRIAPPKALAYAAALACTALLIQGSAVLGSSSYPSGTADVFISVSLILMGAAGPGVSSSILVGLLQLPGAPRTPFYESAVSCLVAGVFDLSALVFAIFHALDYLGFSLAASLFSWTGLSATLATALILVGFQLPAEPEPEPPKLTPMEQTALLERQRREQQRSYDYLRSWVRPKKVNGVWTLLFGPRLSSYGSSTDMEAAEALAAQAESMKPVPGTGTQQEKVTDGSAAGDDPSTARRPFLREMRNRTCGQICSRPLVASLLTPQNLLLVASMGVFNLFSTFYLTSHQDDFELIFSADTAAELNQKLDLSFPLVGFFASFVFMFLFAAVPAEAPFIMVFCLNTSWAILYMIPDIVTQHIAAFLFGLVRVLNWASFYHYISSNSFLYKAHLVGRCLGYNGALIAVIGDASAPILAKYLAAGSWPLDKHSRFLAGKVLLLAIQLPIGIALPWVVRKARLKNEE